MFRKSLVAGLVASAFAPAIVSAADPVSGNMGIYSQYIFRGLAQTDTKPALQGGFDYTHASGFYAGTWLSNVSWLRDFGAYSAGGSLEMDFYGGFKGSIPKTDLGYDIGLLQYYYPGTAVSTKADTLEAYGALSWKWLTAKLSFSLDNKTFGVTDSRGTYYLDLTATFPLTDKLSAVGHYGLQKFSGSGGACGVGVDNDTCASYDDYKVGLTYTLPKDYSVGAFLTGTSMNAAQKAFYTTPANRKLGDSAVTVFVAKTF